MNFFLPEKYIVHYIKKRRYFRVYPKYVFVKVLQNFTETGFLRKINSKFWLVLQNINLFWLVEQTSYNSYWSFKFHCGNPCISLAVYSQHNLKIGMEPGKGRKNPGNFNYTALKEPETERIYTLNHPWKEQKYQEHLHKGKKWKC